MRHIDQNQIRRFVKETVRDELDLAQKTVAGKTSDADRRKYIDANGDKCTALRDALWLIGFGKCWYSEAMLCAEEGEVEHFRPKKQVWKSTTPHSGYWWDAFDWRNLRLAHPLVNKRRRDYSTDQEAGKGCYFPLRDEQTRALSTSAEVDEQPILLDPVVARDCRLLCFDANSGKPIPRFDPEDDPDGWRYQRANESIGYYHLDNGTWNAKREDLMRDVGILCQRVLESAAVGDWSTYETLVDELASFVHPFAEFSSAAIQVVREKGLLDHLNTFPHVPLKRNTAVVKAAVEVESIRGTDRPR
jgi:hypothetical protein